MLRFGCCIAEVRKYSFNCPSKVVLPACLDPVIKVISGLSKCEEISLNTSLFTFLVMRYHFRRVIVGVKYFFIGVALRRSWQSRQSGQIALKNKGAHLRAFPYLLAKRTSETRSHPEPQTDIYCFHPGPG